MSSHLADLVASFWTPVSLAAWLMCLALIAIAISAWMKRGGTILPFKNIQNQFGIYGSAYVLGGRDRVIELAVFRLVRDGWMRHDGNGFFNARIETPPQNLVRIEREVLERVIASGTGLTFAQLAGERYQAWLEIETDLIDQRILISRNEAVRIWILAFAPLILFSIVVSIRLILEGLSAGTLDLGLLICGMGLFFAWLMKDTARGFSTRGLSLRSALRRHLALRSTPKTAPLSERGWDPFNQIDDLEMAVLGRGLIAFAGTAFAPLSTFGGTEAEPAPGAHWGHSAAVAPSDEDPSGEQA